MLYLKKNFAFFRIYSIINVIIFFALLFFSNVNRALAATQFDFQPSIGVEARYDDNIFLSSSDTRSDWITRILPGISTQLLNPRFDIGLSYTPTVVYFLHNPQFDYTVHELNFNTTIECPKKFQYNFYRPTI